MESTTPERMSLMGMSAPAAEDEVWSGRLVEEFARAEKMTLTPEGKAAVLVAEANARAARYNARAAVLVAEANARAARENRLAKEAEERMRNTNLGKNCVSIPCSPHTYLCLHSPLLPPIRLCLSSLSLPLVFL